MICDQFLGKPNDRERKGGGDGHANDAADERDEVGGGVRVFYNNLGDIFIHLYTFLGPNDAKEYPRPNQHDEDAKKQQNVEYPTGCFGSGLPFGVGHGFFDIWT